MNFFIVTSVKYYLNLAHNLQGTYSHSQFWISKCYKGVLIESAYCSWHTLEICCPTRSEMNICNWQCALFHLPNEWCQKIIIHNTLAVCPKNTVSPPPTAFWHAFKWLIMFLIPFLYFCVSAYCSLCFKSIQVCIHCIHCHRRCSFFCFLFSKEVFFVFDVIQTGDLWFYF